MVHLNRMHYAALSGLSCVHKGIKSDDVGHLVDDTSTGPPTIPHLFGSHGLNLPCLATAGSQVYEMQEHNECVHYAALSALSCVHEDIKTNGVGHLVDGTVAPLITRIISHLPQYSRRNVRQALETVIQMVQAVPVCMEDPDIIRVCPTTVVFECFGFRCL
jgi:hypothetical protein